MKCTDLGSLVGNIQWGNFLTFLAILILRKINFGWFQKIKNCHFDHLSRSEFCIFGNFWHFKCVIFTKIKFQSLWNSKNGSFLSSEISQNWFHAKSEWYLGKLLNFHIVEYPKSKIPIRLPRSVFGNISMNMIP